jgi:hypothetical protein
VRFAPDVFDYLHGDKYAEVSASPDEVPLPVMGDGRTFVIWVDSSHAEH